MYFSSFKSSKTKWNLICKSIVCEQFVIYFINSKLECIRVISKIIVHENYQITINYYYYIVKIISHYFIITILFSSSYSYHLVNRVHLYIFKNTWTVVWFEELLWNIILHKFDVNINRGSHSGTIDDDNDADPYILDSMMMWQETWQLMTRSFDDYIYKYAMIRGDGFIMNWLWIHRTYSISISFKPIYCISSTALQN